MQCRCCPRWCSLTPCADMQVCDQPHPIAVRSMVKECAAGNFEAAYAFLLSLWGQGARAARACAFATAGLTWWWTCAW